MKEKTSTFFVIDNFNTIPLEIIEYCSNYIIFDASTDLEIEPRLVQNGLKYEKIPRTGHNLSTYFSFFYENYDNLPEVICLTKGHMIGRHCSKEFFDRVYDNKFFTYLYEDRQHISQMNKKISFLTMENQYLEVNNSWYVNSASHPHKYFVNLNDLLKCLYYNPVLPEYVSFAPGGCYIVRREQVLKHSKEFYKNLNKVMTYGLNPNFPVEAHMVERIMPIIFEANYIENEWVNDLQLFDEKLKEAAAQVIAYDEKKGRKLKARIKKLIR